MPASQEFDPLAGRSSLRAGLNLLGIERLALTIYNTAFPSLSEEELGCGSPYSHGGHAFMRFAHELGFDTLILGPQGQTHATQRSPYAGCAFFRNLLAVAPLPLTSPRLNLLSQTHLQRLVRGAPVSQGGAALDRVDFAYAWNSARGLLDGAVAGLSQASEALVPMQAAFRTYVQEQLTTGSWLERGCLFSALAETRGTDDWARWPEADRHLYRDVEASRGGKRISGLLQSLKKPVEQAALGQFLLQWQHSDLEREARSLGLALWTEVNASLLPQSLQDAWAYGEHLPSLQSRIQHWQDHFDGVQVVDVENSGTAKFVSTTAVDEPPVWSRAASAQSAEEEAAKTFAAGHTHVAVLFTDLFGLKDSYAGSTAPAEARFALRVPADYARTYPANARATAALDLRRVVALALRSKVHNNASSALATALMAEAAHAPF
ncbi:MAG: 4-alpha-glucanotransferase [Deltaproteobacteria bacterium]|nr:4-alpha-glucanotransferase [Deltaproteobacteria bacterium]